MISAHPFRGGFLNPILNPSKTRLLFKIVHFEMSGNIKNPLNLLRFKGFPVSKWRDSNPRPFGPEPSAQLIRKPLQFNAFLTRCPGLNPVLNPRKTLSKHFEGFCGRFFSHFRNVRIYFECYSWIFVTHPFLCCFNINAGIIQHSAVSMTQIMHQYIHVLPGRKVFDFVAFTPPVPTLAIPVFCFCQG